MSGGLYCFLAPFVMDSTSPPSRMHRHTILTANHALGFELAMDTRTAIGLVTVIIHDLDLSDQFSIRHLLCADRLLHRVNYKYPRFGYRVDDPRHPPRTKHKARDKRALFLFWSEKRVCQRNSNFLCDSPNLLSLAAQPTIR
jgi:hypothetical protein